MLTLLTIETKINDHFDNLHPCNIYKTEQFNLKEQKQ